MLEDWKGQFAAIIASGPSTKMVDLNWIRGRLRVAVIKRSIEAAPWADLVYGCDAAWWKHVRGLPDFKGPKITYSEATATKYPGIEKVQIKTVVDELLFDTPGTIGSGGNSGFQLVNILAQAGVRGILLIGFDMNSQARVHWYGRNNWPSASNPSETNFRRWRAAFDRAAIQLAEKGIDVINASPVTALGCFPCMSVEAALKKWGFLSENVGMDRLRSSA